MNRKRRRTVRLEMTALMDVMFLVLVFFVYCIFDMSVHRGIRVNLPNARGTEQKGERIVITLRPDDSLQLNGQDLPQAEIISRLRMLAASGIKLSVIISGDAKAHLGSGIGLLSELKAAGVTEASFQVNGK